MDSMAQHGPVVIGGVDTHAERHYAAALDQAGGLLGTRSFASSSAGYRELLGWLRACGRVEAVAVESTGSYAAGLTCFLRRSGARVVEINQPHRHTRRRVGKSDPLGI